MNAFDIIKTVRITEKGTLQTDKFNQYTVVADRRANAPAIKRAVETLFGVKVVRVNTQNVQGKARRQKTKAAGRTSDWKKAIVTLKKGDKIELH
ncbi:MAG: 50S ribosomal protein L23 [Verrucomicrobia bacterium]|nr:MAG: 50S ribosomal protein L23 [Verrucomicrobiota bacterium]